MKEFAQRAVCGCAGTAIGTVLYQYFTTNDIDWWRGLFVGAIAGIVSGLIGRKRKGLKKV